MAYDVIRANVTGGDQPERINLVPASPNIFSLLGREPHLGRDFRDEEAKPGAGRVAVLAYSFWKSYFGEDRGVLGSTIRLDGEPHTVIGVMPEDFDFIPSNVDVYRPTNWTDRREDRQSSLLVLGRLKAGTSQEKADAELSSIAAQLAREHPEANEGYGARA